jgi:hypothetical protein
MPNPALCPLVPRLLPLASSCSSAHEPSFAPPPLPPGGVLDHKLVAEKYLRASGMTWTVVRPGGLSNDPPSKVRALNSAYFHQFGTAGDASAFWTWGSGPDLIHSTPLVLVFVSCADRQPYCREGGYALRSGQRGREGDLPRHCCPGAGCKGSQFPCLSPSTFLISGWGVLPSFTLASLPQVLASALQQSSADNKVVEIVAAPSAPVLKEGTWFSV